MRAHTTGSKKAPWVERWWIFLAYNSPAVYGYGTKQEADDYCHILNRDRDVNA
jgi:hypothetical protein